MNGKKVVYKGEIYESFKDVAKKFGLGYATLMTRLSRGMSLAAAVENPVGKNREPKKLVYKGKEYKCIKKMTKELGLEYGRTIDRLKKGYSLEDAIELPLIKHERSRKSVVYKGKEYRSVNQMCTELGMSRSLFNERIRKGMSLEEAIEKPVRKKRKS